MSATEITHISVNARALRRLLEALNGPGHLIRELQVTRGPLFEDNPIDTLTKEFNQWAADLLESRKTPLQAAFDEWHEKTEWVQATAQPHELGMHRADVLKQRIERLQGQVNALTPEAERYQWMFSAHTEESLAKAQESGVQPEPTPQDRVLALISSWYTTKAQADALIDDARKG